MHALPDREVQSKISRRNGAQMLSPQHGISAYWGTLGRAFRNPVLGRAADSFDRTAWLAGSLSPFSIGAGWCQALSDCSVDPGFDVTRKVLASLRDRHFGPPMMGSGGCGGPISRDVLAVRPTAGIRTQNGLASSIVPAGTSLHRSAEFRFSPRVLDERTSVH